MHLGLVTGRGYARSRALVASPVQDGDVLAYPVSGEPQTIRKDRVPNTDVVRASFEAYHAQDQAAAEQMLADDCVFTSPQDDHIGKAAFLERCFPTADRFVSQEIVELAGAGESGVFLLYQYELTTGERYRNAEFSTVRDGQITETQVFFGGRADEGR